MKNWARGLVLATVFALVGALTTSMWLELHRETRARRTDVDATWHGRRIRVEVLNGAGVDGLARRVTERLRDRGFDVVHYGNADQFGQDTTLAIARLEDAEPARRVADALGLRKVAHRPDRNLYLDVTLVLGRDWEEGEEGEEEEAASAARTGWRAWWGRLLRAASRLWPREAG